MTALNNFRLQWAQKAIASGQIKPEFFPTYAAIMNIPLPAPNMTQEQFNGAASQLAMAIKTWYTNAKYSGNLAVLSQTIDASKPTFAGAAVASATAPASTTDPRIYAVANRFFKSNGGVPATVDFAGEFANFKGLGDADIIDINNLIETSTSTTNFNSISDKLKSEGGRIKSDIAERRKKVDALNQQFVDDKAGAGLITKPKVIVLQDYILAGFVISYLFFAVVVVYYFTKNSEKPFRSFLTLTTLMVIVSAILYTWTSYLA